MVTDMEQRVTSSLETVNQLKDLISIYLQSAGGSDPQVQLPVEQAECFYFNQDFYGQNSSYGSEIQQNQVDLGNQMTHTEESDY